MSIFKWLYRSKTAKLEEMLRKDIDAIKSRIDLSEDIVDEYSIVKDNDEYNAIYEKESPLVTVCIGTYNRAGLLVKRSLSSVLDQTYHNIEIIVVGDCCTDDTEAMVSNIDDNRLTFINLDERSNYPNDPERRWMVAGTKPVNHALELSRGDFITHIDDDDRYEPDRIECLVDFVKETRAEFVWHPFYNQKANGRWKLYKCEKFQTGQVTTSSVFYHHWFKKIPWDISAWRWNEAGDWNRFRKIKYLKPRLRRYPKPLTHHYKERNQTEDFVN